MHHPFHIHGAGRFLVLSRDGSPLSRILCGKIPCWCGVGRRWTFFWMSRTPAFGWRTSTSPNITKSGMMFSFTVARAK